MRPFVLIGTGGSGGKTVRMVREVLRQRLEAADWGGEWPQAWQLLHIDVPAIADGVSAELPFTLRREQYFPLTDVASTYTNADLVLSRLKGEPRARYRSFDAWRPFPPHAVHVDVTKGAGQYRSIGRVLALANLGKINKRILQSINDARSAPLDVLAQIEKALFAAGRAGDARVDGNDPMVIVAGSLAGGSGSGSLLDICDLLRAAGHKPIALQFAPELFAGGTGASGGLAPNTFMALSEISNAMWVSALEDSPASRDLLFAREGIVPSHGQGGPSAALLVGSRNAHVHLGAAAEIYHVMGRAIAEWLIVKELQDEFTAYILGNAEQATSGSDDFYPVRVTNAPGPQFYGLGFARLSIGRDYFQRYSAERLARSAVLRLLDYHLSVRKPGETATDREMVLRLAELMDADFIDRCGLDEVGDKSNQVLDAVSPPEVTELLDTFTSSEIRHVIEAMGGSRMRAEEVRGMIVAAAEAQLAPGGMTVRNRFEAALHDQAASWTQAIQDQLQEAIPATISSVGLPVTHELLEKAIGRVRQAAEELDREARNYLQSATDRLDQLRVPIAGGPARIRDDDQSVRPLVRIARSALGSYCASIQCTLVAALLRDIGENLLVPWRMSVIDAEALLRLEVRPTSGAPSEVDFWPGDRGVPEQYRPSKIEFLLEDPDDFPEAFEQMIIKSVDDEDDPSGAQVRAVRELLQGTPKGSAKAATSRPFSKRRANWIPTPPEVRSRTDLPTAASIELHLTVDDILDRASEWLRDTTKFSGRHLRQSLAEYLDDEQEHAGTRAQRRTTLVGQFQSMLQTSAPLVSINPTLLEQIHSRSQQGCHLIITPLNIPDDPGLKAKLRDAAVAAGVTLKGDTSLFTDAKSQSSQAFQVHSDAGHQVVFDSVMEPLASRWSKVKENEKLRHDFWKYRRARPLSEWVPVDPETRRAIVLGWLTGRLLGQARYAEDAMGRTRLEVYGETKSGPDWMAMPAYGPREVTPDNSAANVLELVPVGIIEAYAAKSLTPLMPWKALIALASTVGGGRCPVSKWITDGSGLHEQGAALLASGAGDDSIEGRTERIRSKIQIWAELLESDTKIPDRPDVLELQATPVIEIHDDYDSALTKLLEAVAKAKSASGPVQR